MWLFMENLFRWFRSYLVCSFKGGDLERLFNMCRHQHIECWNMTLEKGCCRCRICLRDFWKIRSFIRKTKVRVHIEEKHGFAFFLVFLQKRKGLWIGMTGCILMLYFLSAHIWKLEFYGNSYYTDEKLSKYLSEYENIHPGIWKQTIDSPSLEENLRLTFPDISWISIRTEGTSLIVSMEEMVKYDAETDSKSLPRYIVAKKDGEIVSMVTRSGIPKVGVKDKVSKGDLLIDGINEIKDDSMTVTEIRTVGADGDIYAVVTETYNKTYEFLKTCKKYEKPVFRWTLSIGNQSFTFGKGPGSDEKNKTYDHFTEIFCLFSDIYLQKDQYISFEILPEWISSAACKKQAEDELSDTIREFSEKGVQILENNVKIVMYENRAEAKGNFVLIESIGENSETLMDEAQNGEIGETHEYNRIND